MALLAGIESEIKEAIKKKDDDTLRTLRMLKSDIMYEKGKGTTELSDDAVLDIIHRAAKKRKEAIEEYQKAGRTDLAERERTELHIIEKYLPKQLNEGEIDTIIDAKITELGEVTKKDFGKLMGLLMNELKGRADGNVVKQLLNQKLEQL
jgi:uncharacterized protein YqeY